MACLVASLIIPLLLVFEVRTVQRSKGVCAAKSSCNEGGDAHFLQACVSNTPSDHFLMENEHDSEAYFFLNAVCPHLTKTPNVPLCCDTSQLLQLKNQMEAVRTLLRRCPSCLQNFQSMWCNVLCHPDQSTFVEVTAADPYNGRFDDDAPSKYNESVDAVTVYLTEDFATKLYQSCASVKFPSTGLYVISAMCSGRPPSTCGPQKFLDYIGAKSNRRSPSDFTFVVVDETTQTPSGIKPLDLDLFHCSESGFNNSEPCSCVDCPQSCAKMDAPVQSVSEDEATRTPWRLLGVSGYVILVSVAYIAISCIYIVVSYMHCLYYKKPDLDNSVFLPPSNQGHKSTSTKSQGMACSGGGANNPNGGNSATGSDCGANGAVGGGCQSSEAVIVEIGVFEQISRRFQKGLNRFFYKWGLTMASQPVAALLFGTMLVAICSNGLHYVRWTTDPVELWSSKTSQAYQEMQHFNAHFGPFYRIEQVIVKLKPNTTAPTDPFYTPSKAADKARPSKFSPILDAHILHEVLYLQENISSLVVYSERHERNVTLSDVCHKPMAPLNDNCAVMSVPEWFQNSHENIDQVRYKTARKRVIVADHYKHLAACIESSTRIDDGTPLHRSCLASWGGVVDPLIALGGFQDAEYERASALVITFLVRNSLNSRETELAEDFEAGYLRKVREFQVEHPHLSVAYQAQRSIEDEIERESAGDIKTVLCSYLIMFGYITLCLGRVGGCSLRSLVDMKVTVGIGGVVIVMSSVVCSIGVFGFIGVPATLIIMEVVPFLVLAVGVDNIFILVQYFQRYRPKNKDESLEVRIATVFSRVAPSMLLSSSAEALAFFLGAMTPMPAVRTFSLYAGMAVAFDFLFQITCFVGLLTLDAKRQRGARLDVACCFPVENCDKARQQEGMVYSLFRNYYSPILFSDTVRPLVIVIFGGWFIACVCMMPHIPIGLDQSLSVPSDSYMRDYFSAISEDLNVGSPVYFVLKGPFPYDDPDKRKLVCGLAGCSLDSIVEQISRAADESNVTKIAKMPNSWVDDYLDWSDPQSGCCRFYEDDQRKFCNASVKLQSCNTCEFDGGRLEGDQFYDLLPFFLRDIPTADCPKAGKASYADAVSLQSLDRQMEGDTSGDGERVMVVASHFMTYHTALRTSQDFTEALTQSRLLAAKISDTIGIEVYPYSVFYVFYEQYLTIVEDTFFNMSVSLVSIFLVTFFFLGLDLVSALFVGLTILMIIVSMCGLMYLWDISLNAISLVNLVMAVGISVEFCAHTVRTFAVNPNPSRLQRAKDSLLEMGSSVLSGITLTKLGGILVLGFSNSQLFKVFYFRMYLGIVIFGAAHGLAFLPVLLSYIGVSHNSMNCALFKTAFVPSYAGYRNPKGNRCQKNPNTAFTPLSSKLSRNPGGDSCSHKIRTYFSALWTIDEGVAASTECASTCLGSEQCEAAVSDL